MSPGSWLWQFMGEARIEGEAAESEVLPEREFAPLWCWECCFQSFPDPVILPAGDPGRPGLGLHNVQLVEPWALSGGWSLGGYGGDVGVEDLECRGSSVW